MESKIKESVSRQSINLNTPMHSGCTMRMTYMYKTSPCTEIDVDFLNRKIYIQNKTDDILHRAFGVVEAPDWEDFELFLEERCPPRSRGDIKSILKRMGIDSYDPIGIIEHTEGRCVEDKLWIKICYRDDMEQKNENDQC